MVSTGHNTHQNKPGSVGVVGPTQKASLGKLKHFSEPRLATPEPSSSVAHMTWQTPSLLLSSCCCYWKVAKKRGFSYSIRYFPRSSIETYRNAFVYSTITMCTWNRACKSKRKKCTSLIFIFCTHLKVQLDLHLEALFYFVNVRQN